MAWLSYLDECDERARASFGAFAKRWSARRREGLTGRPRPPKARRAGENEGHGAAGAGVLVSYGPCAFEERPRKAERHWRATAVPKMARGAHGRRDRYTFSATARQHY